MDEDTGGRNLGKSVRASRMRLDPSHARLVGSSAGVRFAAVLLVGWAAACGSAFAPDWAIQVGTSSYDGGNGVAADGLGNVFFAGHIAGPLHGVTPPEDVATGFLAKYDSAGTLGWMRLLNVPRQSEVNGDLGERCLDVVADSSGNAYVSGYAWPLDLAISTLVVSQRDPNPGFVAKFDAHGNQLWQHLFSLPGRDVHLYDLALDPLGNLFVGGDTQDRYATKSYLAKLSPDGTPVWTREFAAPPGGFFFSPQIDQIFGVAADHAGNTYVTGVTLGDLAATNAGSGDGMIAKFDAQGNVLWMDQWGDSSGDRGNAAMTDAHGNVYIAGDLGSAGLLAKYSPAGVLLWRKQFGGSESSLLSRGIAADGRGDLWVVGSTRVAQPLTPTDTFVAKFTANGDLLGIEQFGTSEDDYARDVSADGWGNVYVAGTTNGSLFAAWAGSSDAFLLKFASTDDLPGDFDRNGRTDGGDLLLWQRDFGSTTNLSADGDASGQVDAGDAALWATHFGQAIAGASADSAVPERAGCALACCLAAGAALGQRTFFARQRQCG